MESKKMIGGLLAGAAMGVAIGMLLAPYRGVKTQKKLSKKAQKLLDNLKAGATKSISGLQEKYADGVEESSQKGHEIVNKINENVNVR